MDRPRNGGGECARQGVHDLGRKTDECVTGVGMKCVSMIRDSELGWEVEWDGVLLKRARWREGVVKGHRIGKLEFSGIIYLEIMSR